jgi:hypothetical protein
MKRTLKLLIWSVTGVGVAAVAMVGLVTWRSPPYYDAPPVLLPVPILTMAEYDEVSQVHPRPYLVQVQASPGGILLFGAAHTRDPSDPELAMLAREWDAFHPTVALAEGRLGFLFPHLMNPVEEYGEMGAAAARARVSDVPLYTWEPRREGEVRRMLDSFPAPRVALFYSVEALLQPAALRPPQQPGGFRGGVPEESDAVSGARGHAHQHGGDRLALVSRLSRPARLAGDVGRAWTSRVPR